MSEMPLSVLLSQFYEWDATIYTFGGILKGHDGPINAFTFNGNGTLLASGGDDEQVRIWDINAFRQCQSLLNPNGRWGQITCLKFINLETPSAAEWLCFGTGRGMVALYRKGRRAAEFVEMLSLPVFSAGDSVETLAFDPSHQRLAVSSHYGHIKMLRYQNGKFAELWSDELLDTIPRALLFSDNGRSLTVFTLETGIGVCRDAETSMTITSKNLKTAIGYVSQCLSTGNILVDNMHDGFDLYAPNRPGPTRTFRIEMSKMYVKTGIFCEGGKVVACGSDHGRVYVFGVGEAQAKQELVHGSRQDMIQTVEATIGNGFHIIVSGASSGKCDIYVWKKPVKGPAYREKRQLLETLVAINITFFVVFLLLTREAWSTYLKVKYASLSAQFLESPALSNDLPGKVNNMEMNGEPDFVTPFLQNILYELDDEAARRLLKMPAAISAVDEAARRLLKIPAAVNLLEEDVVGYDDEKKLVNANYEADNAK